MTNPSTNLGAHLPSGTVTFLFTDIEGSTKLAQQYPDKMPALLARHHEILNRSIQTNHGYTFQVVGDSFAVAFHSARDALNTAVNAQRDLQNERWDPDPIKVRMGIHTGTAQLNVDSQQTPYIGYATIALTQRVMSAGHGGQILLSEATYDLIKDQLPEQVELRDMGERRLKSILRPARIYQLTVPDLPSDFPPLNTLESFNHNLPAQLTSFIGREKELDEIKKLVAENRMVTLAGAGGAGKTRLSLQIGADGLGQFSNGVWFAELAPVSDPALLPQTLLAIFNLRESVHRTPLEVLTDFLRSKELLLILDNCEHLIEACSHISDALLRACPKLKILATSREALGIAGEIPYLVPSLSLPQDFHRSGNFGSLMDFEAIRLFVERAVAAKPDFELTRDNASFVAQTCSHLDGIPLAIELAAARVKVLTPEQIASRLDDRFHLLTSGSRTALPRQQTLRAMIDWSYDLLTEQEKTLFRRLAVFVGGWTLEAAESVCPDVAPGGILPHDILDLLTRLVDKSLVKTEEVLGETRYRRLETIRQYSREKFLETDEVETIRDWHLNYFVRFAESADQGLQSKDQIIWGNRMAAEQDNLRAALEWGLSKNPYSALRIAGSSNLFWTAGGYSAEGFRWTQQALESAGKLPHPEGISTQEIMARAKTLRGLTRLYLSLGDNANAKRVAEESVALYRRTQDRRGLAFALVILAYPLEFLGERDRAETLLRESESIARAEGDVYVLCRALNILARVTIDLYHDLEKSKRFVEEAYILAREAGLRYQEAQSLEILALLAMDTSDFMEARLYFQESVRAYEEVGATFNVILEKSNLAHLERRIGNHTSALEYYRETILAFRDMGQTGAVAHQLECFGFIAIEQNQKERALQLFAAAHALREKAGTPMRPEEKAYFDGQLMRLRDKMESPTLEWIWMKGHAQSMDHAIALALEEHHE